MLKNAIKYTVRRLWGARLFTALNVLGLAIGISSCWLIYRVASYEFSFDQSIRAAKANPVNNSLRNE